MKFDVWHKILAVLFVLAAIGATLAAYEWLGSHDAYIRSQAVQSAQAQVIKQENEQTASIIAQQKARDAATEQQLAAMQKIVSAVKTPQQIVKWLPEQLPTQQPIKIEMPKPTAANPTPAAQATIPQVDLPQLRNYVSACQACSVKLHTAQQDIASQKQQLQLAGEKLSAVEKQRDAAIKAAKGGSFFHRLKHDTKLMVVGGGIALAIACALGHCK